ILEGVAGRECRLGRLFVLGTHAAPGGLRARRPRAVSDAPFIPPGRRPAAPTAAGEQPRHREHISGAGLHVPPSRYRSVAGHSRPHYFSSAMAGWARRVLNVLSISLSPRRTRAPPSSSGLWS